MGQLSVSCRQTVQFLEHHQFKFMKNLRKFEFSDDTIKFKVKVLIFRPPIEIKFLSFRDGILHLKASTGDFVRLIVKIFFGIKRPIDEILAEEKLNRFIRREKESDFKIEVDKFLETQKIKGLAVTDIRLKNGKILIDFAV